MSGLVYELDILLDEKHSSVKDAKMSGLFKKAERLIGDDLWIAELKIGISGGGTINKITIQEFEQLAVSGMEIGKPITRN